MRRAPGVERVKRFVIIAGVAAISIGAIVLWFFGGGMPPDPDTHAPKVCLMDEPAAGSHAGMVRVPGGDFDFGGAIYAEETPNIHMHVNGFWMDAQEVTNDQFAVFVRATGYATDAERPGPRQGAVVFVMPHRVDGSGDIAQWWHLVKDANWRHPGGPDTSIDGRGHFPVVEIDYNDALAYAKWKHRELPTEAEWEYAARAGAAHLDLAQPTEANTWQGIFPVLNSGADGFVGLAPVGCYKPNAFGLYDMIGNVWEWTASLYAPRHGMAPEAGAAARVIKGGSFLCAPNYCMRYRPGSREPQEADLGASHLGFRTISRE